MKQYVRTFACGVALALVACGGKQTVASKSAAAYDEARNKGIPIEAGEHGGHTAGGATASNHGAMPGMDHSTMKGMDHGAAGAMDHSTTAGMDHSKMSGMQHGQAATSAHTMAGMDHSTMPGMSHGSTAGMQHASTAAAPAIPAPPVSNTAIAQIQPAATLRADEFDAPAPVAIEEAAKASGTSHDNHAPHPQPHQHNEGTP